MNDWISVEDELPENGDPVLVTNGTDYAVAELANLKDEFYWYPSSVHAHDWEFDCRDATHWMPLPEPPNKL